MSLSLDNAPSKNEGKVRLPTFEEMVSVEHITGKDDARSDESQTETGAETELQKTERLCANMRREALAEAERIAEQARREAISIQDKTHRETLKQARREFDEEKKDARASVQKLIAELQREIQNVYDDLEPYLLDIVLHISEQILNYELDRDDEAYISIVRNALSIYRTEGKKRTVYLPPKGYDMLVGDDGDGPLAEKLQDMDVELVRDKRIAEGDCLVESAIGSIRAGMVTQLSRMRNAASPKKDE